jgi:hypothetical protein
VATCLHVYRLQLRGEQEHINKWIQRDLAISGIAALHCFKYVVLTLCRRTLTRCFSIKYNLVQPSRMLMFDSDDADWMSSRAKPSEAAVQMDDG